MNSKIIYSRTNFSNIMKFKTTRKRVLHTLNHLENLESRTDWENSLITYFTMIKTNGNSNYTIIELTSQESDIWFRLNK